MNYIQEPSAKWTNQKLEGHKIETIARKLKDLKDVFYDQETLVNMDPEITVYEVESYFPVPDGTEGGLFFGITFIHPGTVGDEYFMTKGHFHQIRNRGEFYYTIKGDGVLLLMDEQRRCRTERMFPGSIHFIPGHTAHRSINTGDCVLSFNAFWPSDAGHDYTSISKDGFSKRMVKNNDKPKLVVQK